MHTTIGQLLVNDALPDDLRDHDRVLDKAGIGELLAQVADKYPDRYSDVAKRLSDVGHEAAFTTGGYSFGLKSLRATLAARKMRMELGAQLRTLYANRGLSEDDRDAQVVDLAGKRQRQLMADVFDEAKAQNHPLAMQAVSGARGSKVNVNSLLGADMLYVDHHDRPIPIPVLRSYSQGLRPVEYFAGAFGARKGVMDLKNATRDAGFLAKQLSQVAHRLLVSAQDDDNPYDDANPRGMPTDTLDPDNEGALLAHAAGGYPRDTELTPKILKDLHSRGLKQILVRSPIVGGPEDGGVYARDVGRRERGGLPPIGDMVGIAAAQALCLAGGTQVQMADGTCRTIETLQPGDLVLGCTAAGVTLPVRVVHRYVNGLRECHETTFRLGTGKSASLLRVQATLDHKLLAVQTTRQGTRHPVAQVVPIRHPGRGKRFYAKLAQGFDDTGCQPSVFALALGLLIGDGSYTGGLQSNGIGFSCYDPSIIADISRYFGTLGCRLQPQTTPGEYRVSGLNGGKPTRGGSNRGVRNPVRRELLRYGLWGEWSFEKHLPDTLNWDNPSVAALLAGLFATDGCVHRCKNGRVAVSFSSSSFEVANGVRKLLMMRFGIFPSNICSNRKKHPAGGYYRPMYNLSIGSWDDVQRFAHVIQIPGVKGPRLTAALAAWPRPKTAAESGRCAYVSQRPLGPLETFDIEVDHPDHLFVLANGLIVSNSEPITQASISSKHSGGIAGASAGAIGGFNAINSLIQVPKTFRNGASHAQLDGRVSEVREAPQGGHYVRVGSKEHYVPHSLAVTVKAGDDVEAGDTLSEGVPNPAEIVRYKGIGAGRRYFVDAFRKTLKDSGVYGHRRNIELLSRGLINHVRLTDELDDWAPDDVVPYQTLERSWQPRVGTETVAPTSAVGRYLERPVLHHTIGTKVGPSMLKQFTDHGVTQLSVHADPPPFEPEMIRGMQNVHHDEDWLARMLGSYQKDSLLSAAHRGAVSDEAGSSYVPALARGENYGKLGLTKGWTAPKPVGSP